MYILICDDMIAEADKLEGLLNDSGFEINTAVFTDANDALEHIRSGAPVDVCFLDIVMPEMSGVELAEALRAEKYPGEIVFLTTSNEYAAESYQVKAFSYLIKPPDSDGVYKILSELEQAKKDDDTVGIIVKTAGSKRLVLFRDISHVEVMGNNIHFRLTDGTELVTRATFAETALALLADKRFIQCHRSYIVNISDINRVQGSEDFITQNGARVPISRNYPNAVKQYIAWVAGGKK
ncbi:MAG: LytTR family DNA-binding domain-containing protein [Defluviitaleaceae bacterium]|nr:LytTR family DNA-binding domain-containing protein [Defluviitaleaceae bacterium]